MSLFRFSVISILLFPILASAAQFYRWVDEDGSVFIQSSIPPEYVKKGYEVIDDKGNVIKTVAPEISEEERMANEAARVTAEMQQTRDEELLRLYRSPSDVDRTMKTSLSRMDMEIQIKRNRIRVKQNEFDALQERAAHQEKAGREVDASILDQMNAIQQKIEQSNLEIEEVKQRQEETKAAFLLEYERMVTLWEMRNGKTWVDEANENTEQQQGVEETN